MDQHPLVSVVIPTYRRSEMIAKAVKSVIDQNYPSIEILVIDDNASYVEHEKLKLVLSNFENVRLVENSRSKGACGARNTGVELAQGRYIAFLDDDDTWSPEKLKLQVEYLENNKDSVAVFCDYVDVDLVFNHKRICAPIRRLTLKDGLSGICPTSTSLVMLRKKTVIQAGFFDELLPSFQDFDMWLRCLSFGDFGCINQPLVSFIQHSDDRTSINLERRFKGLNLFLQKWSGPMSEYINPEFFKKRMVVDALIANGRANFAKNYTRSLSFFVKALIKSGFSARSIFWFSVGLGGNYFGRFFYNSHLSIRALKSERIRNV